MRTITFKDLPRELRRQLKHCRDDVIKAAQDTVLAGQAHAVALTDEKDLVHMGHYKNSWKTRRLIDGGELRNDAPYAGVLEWGRRPKRPGPPYEPIKEWVDRKLVARGDVAPEDAERTAKRIQAIIHVKGTKPRFVLRDTWRWMRKRFRREVARRARRRRL